MDDTNKQIKIEESLRRFWAIELESLLKSYNFSMTNVGLKLLIDQIKHIQRDIFYLLNDKKYTKGKSYIADLRILEPSFILSIIFSQVIPFCFKYKDILEQPVSGLFRKIGKKLYTEIYRTKYINAINSNEISPEKITINSGLSLKLSLPLLVEKG